MIGFGFQFQVDIDGPFSEWHPLGRVARGLFFLAFVLFGNYVPLALAVWLLLVGEPKQPPAPLWAHFFIPGLLLGMFALGGVCIGLLVSRLTCGQYSGLRILVGISLLSLAVASLSLLLGCWHAVLLAAFAGILFCVALCGPLAKIGQVLHRRRKRIEAK